MKRRKKAGIRLAAAVIAGAMLLVLTLAVIRLQEDSGEKGREILESSVSRTVMACYAAEGVYPPDIEYMKEHYALQINEEKYKVIYSVFAENLMPEITVLERSE